MCCVCHKIWDEKLLDWRHGVEIKEGTKFSDTFCEECNEEHNNEIDKEIKAYEMGVSNGTI